MKKIIFWRFLIFPISLLRKNQNRSYKDASDTGRSLEKNTVSVIYF